MVDKKSIYGGRKIKAFAYFSLILGAMCFLYADIETQIMMDSLTIDIEKLGPVCSLDFRSDGKYFATGTYEGHIILWDIPSGRPLRILKGHSLAICSVMFVQDTDFILSGGADCTSRLWDINNGKEILRIKGELPINTVDLSPDQKFIITGYWRCTKIPWWGLVAFWDAETGNKVASIKELMVAIEKVSFSHDGNTILILTTDGLLSLWDSKSRNRLRTFNKNKSLMKDFCFSPDDRWIAGGGKEEIVRLWDKNTGEELLQFRADKNEIFSLAFSGDGNLLAAGCGNEGVRIWDVKTAKQLMSLTENAYFVKFTSDSKYLFISDLDTHASFWCIPTKKEIKRFKIYPYDINELRRLKNRSSKG